MADIQCTVLSGTHGQLGQITLCRETAMNALNHEMILEITRQLRAWESDNTIKAVIMRSSQEKAFCAGGDIRQLYQAGKSNDPRVLDFFRDEYNLNYYIHHYPKPYIALINGVVMGGGVGISIHGSQRIAAEKITFAMPETGIGFFPDIGGSYFLARCPGETGYYLGLTGDRINTAEALALGIVTHHIPRAQWDAFIQGLLDHAWQDNPHQEVAAVACYYHQDCIDNHVEQKHHKINQWFAQVSLDAIIHALKNADDELAHTIQKTLQAKSPLSLSVVFEQLHRGKHMTLAECLAMEFTLVQHFLAGHDFYEGVRSVIIDKDQQPQWRPNQLNAVTQSQVQAYFEATSHHLELNTI
ncbi:MAG: enoyl-CoA hydratase/isomerase family protein [Gammaproteobacteria bacterium]